MLHRIVSSVAGAHVAPSSGKATGASPSPPPCGCLKSIAAFIVFATAIPAFAQQPSPAQTGAAAAQTQLLTSQPNPPLTVVGQRLVLPKRHLGNDYLLSVAIVDVDANILHFLPIMFSPDALVHFARVEERVELVADARGQAIHDSATPNIIATFPIVDEDKGSISLELHGGSFAGLTPSTAHIRSVLAEEQWSSFEAVEQIPTMMGNVSAVIRYTLRKLPEDPIAELPLTENSPAGYFATSRFLPGVATPHKMANRWDIRRPVAFSISSNTPELYRPAMMDGVLAWNEAFGREVVKVDMAPAGVTPGDPRYNLIQWVDDDELGMGIGWSTTDPRNGQTLQGLIVITSGWTFPWKNVKRIDRASADIFNLRGMKAEQLCDMDAADAPLDPLDEMVPDLNESTRRRLGLLQLRTVIMHEVGHVLGLRHNFAASLDNEIPPVQEEDDLLALLEDRRDKDAPLPASSVMDYLARKDDVRMHGVGAYDKLAIAWGYGKEPAQGKFDEVHYCTDHQACSWSWFGMCKPVADCQRRDHGAEPVDWWVERIDSAIDRYNDWIIRNAIVPADRINSFRPDTATREKIMATAARARSNIENYANQSATVWYMNDKFPNERREYAAHALDRFGPGTPFIPLGLKLTILPSPPVGEGKGEGNLSKDTLVRPKLAAAIANLEGLSRSEGVSARWARFTLVTIEKYIHELHAAIGR